MWCSVLQFCFLTLACILSCGSSAGRNSIERQKPRGGTYCSSIIDKDKFTSFTKPEIHVSVSGVGHAKHGAPLSVQTNRDRHMHGSNNGMLHSSRAGSAGGGAHASSTGLLQHLEASGSIPDVAFTNILSPSGRTRREALSRCAIHLQKLLAHLRESH